MTIEEIGDKRNMDYNESILKLAMKGLKAHKAKDKKTANDVLEKLTEVAEAHSEDNKRVHNLRELKANFWK